MPKSTAQDEVTSNSEKIKLMASAVIELRLPECIRQAGSSLHSDTNEEQYENNHYGKYG